MLRLGRRCVLAIACCLLWCLPRSAWAAAPEPGGASSSGQTQASPRIDPQENARRLTVACEVLAGLGLEITASMGVVGLGLGAGALASSPSRHDDATFLDARGTRTFLGVSLSAGLLALPAATALGVHVAARARGRAGSYRVAWLSSLVGGAGLGGLTFLVAWPALLGRDEPAVSALFIAGGVSTLGFLAGAIWGEHHSRPEGNARRVPEARLIPVVTRESVGLGVGGAF